MKLFALFASVVIAFTGGCSSSPTPSQTTPAVPAPTIAVAPVVATPVPIVPSVTVKPSPTSVPLAQAAPTAPSQIASSQTPPEAQPQASSVSEDVSNRAVQIRASSSTDAANQHVLVCQSMADTLQGTIRQDPAKAEMYSHQQTAFLHLKAAAEFKANSFTAWNATDANSKLLNMESELRAAQSEAETAQRLIEGRTR